MPVVDMSPGDRVLDLLACLPWTGARARLVPRYWQTLPRMVVLSDALVLIRAD